MKKGVLVLLPFLAIFLWGSELSFTVQQESDGWGRRERFKPLQASQTHFLPHNVITGILD